MVYGLNVLFHCYYYVFEALSIVYICFKVVIICVYVCTFVLCVTLDSFLSSNLTKYVYYGCMNVLRKYFFYYLFEL